MILQQNFGESFLPDLRSRFFQGVVGANNSRNNLKAWIGCRSCRGARLGVSCSAFRVYQPLGQEAHWKSREKLWWEEKGVGDESSAMDPFLYDPGQTKLIPTLSKVFERKWRWIDGGIFIKKGVILICRFTISNVFYSSLMRSVWEVHEVTRNQLFRVAPQSKSITKSCSHCCCGGPWPC